VVRPFRVVIVCVALTGAAFASGVGPTSVINPESGLKTLEVGSGRQPLVLLHGYGSSAREWLPFTATIRVSPATRFIFPEAPGLTVPPDGPEGGRAWWRLDLASYRKRGETIPDLTDARPRGLDDAAGRVRILLKEIRRRLDADHAMIGGFSQGAMIATDIAFRTDEPVVALVILSGTSVDEQAWVAGMSRRKNLRVFIAHGRQDPVLKFDVARRLAQHMRRAGLDVTWVPFDGGHEFPATAVTALNEFLVRYGSAPER
jgi:phospholipase/carboxylesterase